MIIRIVYQNNCTLVKEVDSIVCANSIILLVKEDHVTDRIPMEEILYFEADRK